MIKPGARKPYRVSKQRVPWNQEEHGRFLEAIDRSACSEGLSSLLTLQKNGMPRTGGRNDPGIGRRYGRAWPKIVAHVGGSRSVQQARGSSHFNA